MRKITSRTKGKDPTQKLINKHKHSVSTLEKQRSKNVPTSACYNSAKRNEEFSEEFSTKVNYKIKL